MFRIIIMLIIMAGTPGLLMAQSEFLDKGENAFGACASFSKGAQNSRFVGLDIGSSISGRFDIGLSIQAAFGNVSNSKGLGPYIDYYPLKQEYGRMPLSLAVGLAGMLEDETRTVVLSVALMRQFPLSSNIRILSIITGAYIIDEYEGSRAIQISFPLSVKLNSSDIVFIGPLFVGNESYHAVGISIGVLGKSK